jgi:transcriptional regulator GlxA family with amidase domain
MNPAPRRIPVYVVVPARVLLLDVAGPLEVLRRTNVIQDTVRFDVHHVSPLPEVTSSVGLRIAGLTPLPGALPDDSIVLLSGDAEILLTGEDSPRGAGEEAVIGWLRKVMRPGIKLVSICAGALTAAKAGLLDGRECTTHFLDCARLAEIARNARVYDNRLYVEDGERYTSAGITAGIDLMLHLVGQLVGPATAVAVARYLVVYLRRSGNDPQLSPWLEGRNHIHPAIHRVQDALAAEPARDWNLDALADIALTSSRHLSRLFNEHTGMSIPDYLNRLRVALAAELLSGTRLDMERIAERVGFASSRQLRRAWGRLNDTPPRAARHAG